VQVTVNGVPSDVPDTTTVAALVAEHRAGHDRVAVAVNGGVVPRSRWETSALAPGDAVEVLAPTAGG
jgi:sulfur carrier protein